MPGSNAIKNKTAAIPSISELQKNNPALFQSFYSSPVAKALILNETQKYYEVNKQFLKLLECRREQVIGKTTDELGLWAAPEERTKILKDYRKNRKRSFNFNIRSLKGNIKNVIVSTELIKINGTDFLFGNLLDNTEKQVFENMLKHNEEQYKLLFYKNPLPMCLYDFKTQKFIDVNDALIKHYGYTKKEFLGMKITDITPKEELTKYRAYRKTLIHNKEEYNTTNAGIWKHKKKNDELIDVEINRSQVIFEGKRSILLLANDVTSILEAQGKLKRKNEEVNLLYNSAKEISSTINLEEIYSKIHKVISRLVPCNGMIISSYDRERKLIKCSAAWVKNKKLDVTKIPVLKLDSGGKGLQSIVIKSRKSMIVDDYDKYSKQNKSVIYIYKDNSIRKRLKKSDKINRSALIIPLQLHKKVIGVIQVLSYAKNAYNDEHLKLMETFGAELSTITANARLFEQAQNEIKVRKETEIKLLRSSKDISDLYQITKHLSSSLEKNELYDRINKIIYKSFPECDMGISIFDEKEKNIILESLFNNGKKIDTKDVPKIKFDETGKGLQSGVIKSKRSRIIENYKEFLKKAHIRYFVSEDGSVSKKETKSTKIAESALIVPLLYKGSVLGTIQLLNFSTRPFSEENIKMIEALASHIAVSYMNAKLYQQAQNEIEEKQKAREELALRNKEITLLYRAGRELLSTLDLKEIYEIFYRKTIEVIPCDSMIIAEYNRKSEKIYCKAAWVENTKHNPADFPPLNVGPNYKGTQSEAIVTGNSVIINNFYELIKDRKDKFIIDDEGNVMNSLESDIQMDINAPITRSALFIPMKLGKNVIGVISVFSFKENAYTEYDLKILESISVNLSVAAANAELYNRAQIEISERINKEDELIQIRKNMEEAQRISHLGSWVLDKSTNHITNSREVYKILGLNPRKGEIDFEEAMGYIYEEDKVRTIEVIKNAMIKNVSYVNEDRIIRPDGEIRYVKVMGEPVYDKNGALKGMQGTIQDITDVKRINEEIVRSLGEKEVMIKEIHHRVKNNLQIVSSLLRLQADKIKDKTVVAYFNQSEQRIKSMALIHQQLYQTKDLSRINFREYLNELCSYLLFANDSTPGRINIKIDAQELYLGIDTALPCGLIINELFTNAIKYAFPDDRNGIILIKLYKDTDDKYHLMIKDNGIGATNLDFKKTASLGMELVNTLIDQLEGDFSITIDNGTEINLSFKEPVYSKKL
ncbi:MAG: histidine kinase dimerization/phosphoacceptor domain -containing protein [Ignavibacteria bacterium]